MLQAYKPEGMLIDNPRNQAALSDVESLKSAMNEHSVLEARALICDAEHNLIVELGCCRGIIPRSETVIGLDNGSTRDIAIISRVGKPVCFVVKSLVKDNGGEPLAYLSRRDVQLKCAAEYISQLKPGDVVDARITHLEAFGCFVDIGCGITSLLPIDAISVSRISHPSDRFRAGQEIKAVVRAVDEKGRLTLSHKELLGTWNENAVGFNPGETVAGIVRSVEPYGIFVELTPNLAGLAELKPGVCPGMHTSVYIKSINRDKMKIKLILIDAFDAAYLPPKPNYFITRGHISYWRYSPSENDRVIETSFD